MLIGNFKGVEFTYHHNILVNNTTPFDDYYKAIRGNINKLHQEGYLPKGWFTMLLILTCGLPKGWEYG